MPPSLALAHSSLPFPSRRALPIQLPRRLAHKHPSLCAYDLLHGGTLQRPLRTPRRLAVFARASASAVVPPHGEGGGGTAAGRKGTGYRNRFLDLALLGAVAEGAAEAFFRSEIRRRLVFTAALIVLSRVGYFIPLPGFDRRLIPDSYLSFSPLPAVDLGDFSSELKLSFFQLGISIKFQHLLSCRAYPVQRAPALCGVWGRVSVANLTLAYAMQGDRDSNPGPSGHRRFSVMFFHHLKSSARKD